MLLLLLLLLPELSWELSNVTEGAGRHGERARGEPSAEAELRRERKQTAGGGMVV